MLATWGRLSDTLHSSLIAQGHDLLDLSVPSLDSTNVSSLATLSWTLATMDGVRNTSAKVSKDMRIFWISEGLGFFLGRAYPGLKDHLTLIIILIVVISTIPIILKAIQEGRKSKNR